jgi:hypothetical protein
MERVCECCGTHFTARDKAHRYCSNIGCQRKRKSRWQKRALSIDPSYKGNQADARKRWQEKHPDYWRTYRKCHPQYEACNRRRQRIRNLKRATTPGSAAGPVIANMDAIPPVKSGTYRLVPVGMPMIANMDMVVELSLLSMHCGVSDRKM